MFIHGIGTAVPEQVYTQSQIWDAIQQTGLLTEFDERAAHILEKVLRSSAIERRHLALAQLEEGLERSPDALHARFARNAPGLAAQAARQALESSGVGPGQIDAVLVATCTGYLCPGLSSYVTELLDLRRDVHALDLVGQGCGAAIPALRTARALLAGGTAERVLVICVEVCSAALYLDNDPGVLISACLFGDGAAATVLTARPPEHLRQVQWIDSATRVAPEHRDALRFVTRGGVLRNTLTAAVPRLAAEAARVVREDVFARRRLGAGEVQAWLLHPGGKDVLIALREQLGLSEGDVRYSAQVLRDYGNMSSPSVLFVLDAAMRDSAPAGAWWMSAFGAGFSCHGALLAAQ
ncbi:MAG: 3-oxoacyl-[acyl-carrier-protein] synthase III C-terminal domain-containing protein [Myxococcales bacterium]